jgi:hypothetical protein
MKTTRRVVMVTLRSATTPWNGRFARQLQQKMGRCNTATNGHQHTSTLGSPAGGQDVPASFILTPIGEESAREDIDDDNDRHHYF